MKLITDVQLADDFGIEVEELHRLRARHHWPFVRFGRYEIRFTEEQVAEIVESRTVRSGASTAPPSNGLTERSAARAS